MLSLSTQGFTVHVLLMKRERQLYLNRRTQTARRLVSIETVDRFVLCHSELSLTTLTSILTI